MNKILIGAILAMAFAAPAAAEVKYDRKLEQAVLRIVAEKIGRTSELRGSLSHDSVPVIAAPEGQPARDPMPTGSVDIETARLSVRDLGEPLAQPPSERRSARIIAF